MNTQKKQTLSHIRFDREIIKGLLSNNLLTVLNDTELEDYSNIVANIKSKLSNFNSQRIKKMYLGKFS